MDVVGWRLVVVDRYELFAGALALALEDRTVACHRVVPSELTISGILRSVARHRADVVLLSMDLGTVDPVDMLASLRQDGRRVVALVADDRPQRTGEAYWAGADAVAARTWSLDRLVDVVDQAVLGRPAVPAPVRDRLVSAYQAEIGPYRARLARLSAQEKNLLAHLMEGRGVAEVAAIRTVSEATVRTQARTVLRKLEVSSQLTAVAVARRAGYRPSTLRAIAAVP